ncbi:MAG: hypothetical protein QNJ55_33750 [Xenococcus sp. MO_188.B8]|nr:hypothetical protein [Xenococcus sp. MO_188.B8]
MNSYVYQLKTIWQIIANFERDLFVPAFLTKKSDRISKVVRNNIAKAA